MTNIRYVTKTIYSGNYGANNRFRQLQLKQDIHCRAHKLNITIHSLKTEFEQKSKSNRFVYTGLIQCAQNWITLCNIFHYYPRSCLILSLRSNGNNL